jgi:hypothetical protein
MNVLFVILFAACSETNAPDSCKVVCSADTDCPSGQACGELGLCTAGEACACTANAFLGCVEGSARRCNATANGIADEACGYGCSEDAMACNVCEPSTISCSADGTALEHCSADGQSKVVEACALGCVAGGSAVTAPHCGYLESDTLPNVCSTPASAEQTGVYAQQITLDTTVDALCDAIVPQTGGPEICVIHVPSLSITSALTVKGSRAIAFVADGDISVQGTLDASANGLAGGPGAVGISGAAVSGAYGGGGAGFRTAGSNGGSTNAQGGGGLGGLMFDISSSTLLLGGSHPAAPTGFNSQYVSRGGGGGGGVMLLSCRGTVTVNGRIDLTGGGGQAGRDINTTSVGVTNICAGAGGGSGGNLVLAGAKVVVSGATISANGGGGGGGCSGDNCVGNAGQDGSMTTASAAGGLGYNDGGRGGSGGAASMPEAGGASTVSPGGGGGATGYLQVFLPVSGKLTKDSSVLSPDFQPARRIEIR